MNAVLKRESESLLKEAVQQYEETGQPQRLFTAFWYQAQSWPLPRWTVVKARGFNHRRERDPLGEGHPCTWRMRLIKVAAEIVVRSRRIVVKLAGSWPYLDHYRRVAESVLAIPIAVAHDSG
jgi:hypothetical protein